MCSLRINSISFCSQPFEKTDGRKSAAFANYSTYTGTSSPAGNFNDGHHNYCNFNQDKVDFFVKMKEPALPYLKDILEHSNNEGQVTETLYILDRMIEGGTRGIEKFYPVLSRFNGTNSPYIQTFLAGIYRKIQVPDAFGPLAAMLIRNSCNPQPACFDPNEEIGGALLSYLSDRFRH